MQQSEIGAISTAIKDCLRCGKCKPVCATHVPRANLLYSPRNKILATSLLIEAFLYEEQTRRGISLKHWSEFEDVGDHCTVCHKCYNPCPVDIDFGNVSMDMRALLRRMGKKSFNPGTTAAMFFLNAKDPRVIKATRTAMVDIGYKAQRFAADLFSVPARRQTQQPPATIGKAPIKEQVVHFVNKKMPGGLPKQTARKLLDIEDANYVPIIRNPGSTHVDSEAVFYFPGCGSERLFSQVGLATQAMLWHAGVQTVLPPGYLCCGYPQRGNGMYDKADKIITDNRVLFHRVANTLNYLDIKTVVVSCGTCYDQLAGYEFEKIFPMKLQDPMKTVRSLVGPEAIKTDRCCGESGTLAVSRPDVSTQVRFRKQEELLKNTGQIRSDGYDGDVKMLTSCPSCLQGLSRYEGDTGMEADYIVVEMARHVLGQSWLEDYVKAANAGGIERVLV
jgi:Fe-S oxidoreductase